MLLGIAGDADRHLRMLAAMYLVEAHHFIATELHTEPGPAWERTLSGFASRGIDVVVMNVRTDIAGAVIHRSSGHLLYLGAWSHFQRSLALPAGDYELLPANSMRKLYTQLDFVVGNIAFGGTLQ